MGPVLQALRTKEIAGELAPNCEGTIPPIRKYKAAFQEDASTLRPAPL